MSLPPWTPEEREILTEMNDLMSADGVDPTPLHEMEQEEEPRKFAAWVMRREKAARLKALASASLAVKTNAFTLPEAEKILGDLLEKEC